MQNAKRSAKLLMNFSLIRGFMLGAPKKHAPILERVDWSGRGKIALVHKKKIRQFVKKFVSVGRLHRREIGFDEMQSLDKYPTKLVADSPGDG